MSRLKVGAVGLGWVTTHRHLPVMRASDHFDVVGVIDRSPGKAAALAKSSGYRRFAEVDALDKVSWLDEVDAITVGASPGAHFPLIKSALDAGKHVLTEKPFTLDVREGKELVELAKRRNLILSVVHNFQFASCTRKLEHDVRRGALGAIQGITAVQLGNPRRRLPSWYEQLPLGLFYDESPHFFYMLQKVAPGPLTFLRSDVFPSTRGLVTPASITTHYSCKCADGRSVPVTVFMHFESPVSEWHVSLLGEDAFADLDIFRDIYLRLPNDGLHTTSSVVRTSLLTTLQHWGQHCTSGFRHLAGSLRYGNDEVFERFYHAVRTGTPAEGISAADALAVLERQHEVLDHCNILGSVKP